MTHRLHRLAVAIGERAKRLRLDSRGNIAIMFAFASTAIVIGVGSSIDLSRAYLARQKLSEVATLTCQFSTRPSVVDVANSTSNGSNGFSSYLTQVNAFAASSLVDQKWNMTTATGPGGSSNANYFTATAATGTNTSPGGTAPTGGVTDISADIPTLFLKIVNVSQIHVHAAVNCQTAATTPPPNGNPITEGFETPCGSFCFTLPSGATGTTTMPTATFPASAGYTGSNGTKWTITGYCLETDAVGQISSTTPEGTHSAELDCDNGNSSSGNSAISTKVYLPVGYWELRYNYRSRIDYANYDPTYLCATTAGDLSWANDPGTGQYGTRTNQINVYLDMNTNGSAPMHTTIDQSQQLAGFNLIDMCVYSPTWVERSIKIKVTTPAYYWLSFAADGHNDSYGGQLDNIRLCQETCAATTLQDNFPSSWLAANNGGVNKLLFEDSFETIPFYNQDNPPHDISKAQNLDLSYGTYGLGSGWPTQTARGWAAAPFDQVTYGVIQGAAQGSQYITLDGWNSNGNALRNRSISRPFLLDPGYYQVSYNYLSMVSFNIPSLACVAAPSTGVVYAAQPSSTGTIRYYNTYTASNDTNLEGVFLANGQLISTPVAGAGQGNATSYTNPDGSVSTTPTVPPDSVNYQSYNASVVNPLIDACAYVGNWQWSLRTVAVKVTKPGWYWLTFSANGSTADGNGAAIDDVKLTALGSPYPNSSTNMPYPPTGPLVAIPVPDPQPDTVYSNTNAFNGFYIIADPFAPTAADQ